MLILRCKTHGSYQNPHGCPICRMENVARSAVRHETKYPQDPIAGYDSQQVENDILAHYPTMSQDRAAELRRQAEREYGIAR